MPGAQEKAGIGQEGMRPRYCGRRENLGKPASIKSVEEGKATIAHMQATCSLAVFGSLLQNIL